MLFVPLVAFASQAQELLRWIREAREQVTVQEEGQPDVVLIEAAEYEELQETVAVLSDQSLTRTMDQALSETQAVSFQELLASVGASTGDPEPGPVWGEPVALWNADPADTAEFALLRPRRRDRYPEQHAPLLQDFSLAMSARPFAGSSVEMWDDHLRFMPPHRLSVLFERISRWMDKFSTDHARLRALIPAVLTDYSRHRDALYRQEHLRMLLEHRDRTIAMQVAEQSGDIAAVAEIVSRRERRYQELRRTRHELPHQARKELPPGKALPVPPRTPSDG